MSDQTSCHAVYDGGYCPQGISFENRTELLEKDKNKFKIMVDETLKLITRLLKILSRKALISSIMATPLEAVFDAGVKEISKNGVDDKEGFIWPSYVEDILGPELFDYGYGLLDGFV